MRLCQLFHCTPSQLENESAEIIRMVRIYDMGHPPEGGSE